MNTYYNDRRSFIHNWIPCGHYCKHDFILGGFGRCVATSATKINGDLHINGFKSCIYYLPNGFVDYNEDTNELVDMSLYGWIEFKFTDEYA